MTVCYQTSPSSNTCAHASGHACTCVYMRACRHVCAARVCTCVCTCVGAFVCLHVLCMSVCAMQKSISHNIIQTSLTPHRWKALNHKNDSASFCQFYSKKNTMSFSEFSFAAKVVLQSHMAGVQYSVILGRGTILSHAWLGYNTQLHRQLVSCRLVYLVINNFSHI